MAITRRGRSGALARATPTAVALALALATPPTAALGLVPQSGTRRRTAEVAPELSYRLFAHDAYLGHLMEGNFKEPLGVFFDANASELFVADSKNDLIGIFEPDGTPRFAFGGRGLLNGPRRVRVGADGRIYVLDSDMDRVKVFSYRGEPLSPLRFDYPAQDGAPAGTARIGDFALTAEGGFVLGDLELPQVLLYGSDLSFRLAIRTAPGKAQLKVITGVAVSAEGVIAVTDFEATPVQLFDPTGRFLRGYGKRDIAVDGFSAPVAVEFDEQQNLYVVDLLRHDVKVFDREGRFVYRFGGWFSPQTAGRGPGEMLYPSGVAIAPDGAVYVAERYGNRVQHFVRIPRDPVPASGG